MLPHLNLGGLAPIELLDDQWRALETALKQPLNDELRQAICGAIGYFIHSLRLKEQLSTPRQYANELRNCLDSIIAAVDNLLAMILPLSQRPVDLEAITPKEAKGLMGGRQTIWAAGAEASRTTPADGEVLLVEDHVRALIAINVPERSMAAKEKLLDLVSALNLIRTDIVEQPRKKAGADGYYERHLLLVDLLRVAQAAGDNLDLPEHDIRDSVMGQTVQRTPAYLFVRQIVNMLLNAADSLVAGLQLNAEGEEKLKELIEDNLKKKPGKLIDPLEAARAVIEGGPRGNSAKK